jgi:hypothetical protein
MKKLLSLKGNPVKGLKTPRQWLVRRIKSMARPQTQVGGYPSLSPLSRAQGAPSLPPVDVENEAEKLPQS